MSLFDAPEGSLIVHACNCKGSWGSGIAKEFKERYYEAFKTYQILCWFDGGKSKPGKFDFISINKEKHDIGCLFTSYGYGKELDSEDVILINTILAVDSALTHAAINGTGYIFSNKFNSGLFKIPWEKTEKIINTLLPRYPTVKWIVCDPNLNSV